MKLWHKRTCKGAVGSTVNIVKSKVGVRRKRLEELEALKLQLGLQEPAPENQLVLKAVNFDSEDISKLGSLGLEFSAIEIGEESWKETVAIFSSKDPVDALLLKLKGDELLDVERSIICLCFMKNLPVAILGKADTPAEKAALELTAGTFKVMHSVEDVAKAVTESFPKVLALRNLVQEDIAKKVEKYKKVNVVKHFGKRAAVALIPFAVSAVNFAGLLRLIKRMMSKTGMVVNKEVAKTVGKHTAVASIQALALDEMGDLYQYAVAATIVADLGSALVGEGVSAALATLDAVDFVLLGSVSFVTGTLSALGAYLTRPQMVDAITKFLATLQVIYLLNPDMRRQISEEDEALVADGSSDESDLANERELSELEVPLLEQHDRLNDSSHPNQSYTLLRANGKRELIETEREPSESEGLVPAQQNTMDANDPLSQSPALLPTTGQQELVGKEEKL